MLSAEAYLFRSGKTCSEVGSAAGLVLTREPSARGAGATAPVELRHELVAVAAVDRPHVLDDAAVFGARRTLEEECGRVERNTECRRLLLVRHGGLDRLVAADDLDPVALLQDVVERLALEV